MATKREKVLLAFLGSVLIHGLLIVIFAVIVVLQPPARSSRDSPEPAIQLSMVPEETPTPPPLLANGEPPPPTPTPRGYSQSSDGAADQKSPLSDPNALASDKNQVASSAEASSGTDRTVPTQSGRKMAVFQFDPEVPAVGKAKSAEQQAVADTAPPPPKPDLTVRDAAATDHPAPTPAPTAAPDDFAMIMATPTPPEDPFDPTVRSTSPPRPQPSARPRSTRAAAAPVSDGRSASSGQVSSQGKGSINTVATPRGKYMKGATDKIRFIWNRALEERSGATHYGVVVVDFTIDHDGQVMDPHVISNTANETVATAAMQAILECRLPPIPADAQAEIGDSVLEMTITFDLIRSYP